MSTLKYVVIVSAGLTFMTACQKEIEEPSKARYLYVASGACYSGTGNTTYTGTTAANVVFRLNLSTGQYEGRIADFTAASEAPGTTPVSIIDYSETHMLALLQHASLRRIELIEKTLNGERQVYYNNTSNAAPHGALQSNAATMAKVPEGLLISRTTAIEKIDTGKTRIAGTGTNAWVQGPGGACSTSAVNINSLTIIPTTANTSGYNIFYTHSQNASSATNNRVGVINGDTGWNGTAGCLDDQATVGATAYPTASAYMRDFGRLVVAYAGTNVANQNSLYTYAVDEAATSNIISDATEGFEDPAVMYGASAMVYDDQEGYLYVAVGGSIAANLTTGNVPYRIEKFSYNPATKAFTRVGSSSFYAGNIETRCVSSMFIGH